MSENMLGVALCDVRGPLSDLLEKLSGADGPRWARAFGRFLRKENPWDFLKLELNWRAVYEKLGLLPVFEEFVRGGAGSELAKRVDLWAVPVLNDVSPNAVVKTMQALGVEFYLYTQDLDRDVTTNDRDPRNGSYVVCFQRTTEADPELANRSANDLIAAGIKGITLLERLLLELAYFLATDGEHLDVENITLCSGSRYSGGYVPGVYWYSGDRRLSVRWSYPDHRDGHLRARAVVSLASAR